MLRPLLSCDWHRVHPAAEPVSADGFRTRVRLGLAVFMIAVLVIYSRLVAFEWREAAGFREAAAEPIERVQIIAAPRGRILARDGTVLVEDRTQVTLELHYRYLEQPPDAAWLRSRARVHLPREQRRDPAALEQAVHQQRAQLDQMHRQLAALCGLSIVEWNQRREAIQQRVTAIRDSVNRRGAERSQAKQAESAPPPAYTWAWFGWLLKDTLSPDREAVPFVPVTVAEELEYHALAEGLPLQMVAEIEAHPEQYPGVRIGQRTDRYYLHGDLAAHAIGHLGRSDDGRRRVGAMGIERAYEDQLRGRDGQTIMRLNRRGQVQRQTRATEPISGADVRLTLDASLQQTAEQLLDATLLRRVDRPHETPGGAIVVLDVRNGAVLAAASAPRFDPAAFATEDTTGVQALLDDLGQPMFDRSIQMAIPPGSIFKIVSAVALLESHTVAPTDLYECRGYLHTPDRLRCAIFRQTGKGHGPLDLHRALAESCNTYFFDASLHSGPGPLVHWASWFGLGRQTGIELPGEASGQLPTLATIRDQTGHAWRPADTQAMAIGQSTLLVTPVQAARMMAAVANGGELVVPHLVQSVGTINDQRNTPGDRETPAAPAAGPSRETLERIRAALVTAVSDPRGTAFATVHLDSLATGGKTGTAEVGAGRTEHAWFVGFAPAERPKVAFAVAIAHGGNGGEIAGPVARRLVQRMRQLGYFTRPGFQPH